MNEILLYDHSATCLLTNGNQRGCQRTAVWCSSKESNYVDWFSASEPRAARQSCALC